MMHIRAVPSKGGKVKYYLGGRENYIGSSDVVCGVFYKSERLRLFVELVKMGK